MSDRYYEGDRIYFRPIALADEALLRCWMNSPENWATLGRISPITSETEKDWINGLYKPGGPIAFLIVIREGDEPIGVCGLREIHPINRSGTFGITIGDVERQNQGYGTEATKLLLRYAFEELNLNRVSLGVLASHPAAIRAYERAGFAREGYCREAYFRGGRYVDEVRYGILREDWAMRNPVAGSEAADLRFRRVLPMTRPGASAGVA
jgi:RimJ/RimL family protein N-acetyltransferase